MIQNLLTFDNDHPNGTHYLVSLTDIYEAGNDIAILMFDYTTSTAGRIRVRIKTSGWSDYSK